MADTVGSDRSGDRTAAVTERSSAVDVRETLSRGGYDHLDLGCGPGGSIGYARRRFGAIRSLGVDFDRSRLPTGADPAADYLVDDASTLSLPSKCVSFVTMMDFLEHLPDQGAAAAVLGNAGRAARDFLFIRHPSFEAVDSLARLGLKIAWTDVHWHPNPMRIGDFHDVLGGLGWRDVRVVRRMPIADSNHEAILPLGAPPDQHRYDRDRHGPKPFHRFRRPLPGQYDLYVRLNPALPEERWREIVATSRIGGAAMPDPAWWQRWLSRSDATV